MCGLYHVGTHLKALKKFLQWKWPSFLRPQKLAFNFLILNMWYLLPAIFYQLLYWSSFIRVDYWQDKDMPSSLLWWREPLGILFSNYFVLKIHVSSQKNVQDIRKADNLSDPDCTNQRCLKRSVPAKPFGMESRY